MIENILINVSLNKQSRERSLAVVIRFKRYLKFLWEMQSKANIIR